MKKLITLLTLALLSIGSAWAASVGDLKSISSNFTFIADDITSNGTAKLTANTLYCDGYIFAPTANSVSTSKGNSTINGVHLNSLRLKNTQDQLCFKVAGACKVTFFTQSHGSRGIQAGSTAGGTEFGSQPVSTTTWTVDITKGGTVYLSSFGGDFYFAGFKVVFPKPEITTQPIGGNYAIGDNIAALTIEASASENGGNLSYQWYSCDNAQKTNSVAIEGATSSSFTPAAAAWYYCIVTDSNGNTESNVVEISISSATLPTVSISASSTEVEQSEDVQFTATMDGVPVPTIQWYSCDDSEMTNAVALGGETNVTFAPSTDVKGTFYYYAVASNSVGNTTSNVIALTVVEGYAGQTLYSWDSGTESGGAAVASDGESVGYANSVYTTIRLNGKNDFTTNIVTITFDKALKAGDKIFVTGYRNKNDNNKKAGFKAKFEKGSSTVASSTGLEFVNIDSSDASSSDSNRGTEPNTCTFVVPVSAAGSKTMTMTRSNGDTNQFITKIEIYRPAISLDVVLNEAGLLTEDEVSNAADFSFGVTSANKRVAADADNAVTVISGKYYNDHGCTGLSVVAKVPGKVKITIGQCTFSKNEIVIKNSSDVVVAALAPSNPACWKNSHSNVNEFYYNGEATTLTITGMGYCPYIGIEEVFEVPAIGGTITESGYNTFSSCYPLDLSTINGGEAYIATSVTDGKVVLSKVDGIIVAAGTGLFIVGEAGEEFTIGTTDIAPTFESTNLLVGMPDGGEVAKAGDGGFNYVFGWQEATNPGFYLVNATLPTLAANKAYLHTTEALDAPTSSRLAISFDAETTGINTKQISKGQSDNELYDLQGRRVAQPTKGLYIVNGKKLIMK